MPKIGCLGQIIIALVVVLVLVIVGVLFFPTPRPHVVLPADAVFYIAGFPVTNTLLASWLSILILVVLFYVGTRNMRLVPRGLQNVVEIVVEMLFNFVVGVAGEKNGRRFFPVIATIFLFVIINALLALLPGFHTIGFGHHGEYQGAFFGSYDGFVAEVPLLRKASTDVNFPLAIAIMSGLFGWFWGIRISGPSRFLGEFFRFGGLISSFKYLARGEIRTAVGGFLPGIIDIFIGFVELISHFIRIVSFTFRLFGNMTASEVLILMIAFLIPWVAVIPFFGLEIILGFVQALIFAGLTLVFATVAVTPHDAEQE